MLNWDDQPVEIQNFRDFLRSRAGDLVLERSEGVANQVMRGFLGEARVEVVADRSVWFFSIARSDGDYFDLEYWLQCIEGIQGDTADWSLKDWTERVQLLLSSPVIERVKLSCVEAARDAVASRYN